MHLGAIHIYDVHTKGEGWSGSDGRMLTGGELVKLRMDVHIEN